MGGKIWTPDEENLLKDVFPLTGSPPKGAALRRMAVRLGRAENAVRKHWNAMHHHTAARNRSPYARRSWTPTEDEVLIESYPLEGIGPRKHDVKLAELVQLLSRSQQSIQTRWWNLSKNTQTAVRPVRITQVEPVANTSPVTQTPAYSDAARRAILETMDTFSTIERLRAESPAFRAQLASIIMDIQRQRGQISTPQMEREIQQAVNQLLHLL